MFVFFSSRNYQIFAFVFLRSLHGAFPVFSSRTYTTKLSNRQIFHVSLFTVFTWLIRPNFVMAQLGRSKSRSTVRCSVYTCHEFRNFYPVYSSSPAMTRILQIFFFLKFFSLVIAAGSTSVPSRHSSTSNWTLYPPQEKATQLALFVLPLSVVPIRRAYSRKERLSSLSLFYDEPGRVSFFIAGVITDIERCV